MLINELNYLDFYSIKMVNIKSKGKKLFTYLIFVGLTYIASELNKMDNYYFKTADIVRNSKIISIDSRSVNPDSLFLNYQYELETYVKKTYSDETETGLRNSSQGLKEFMNKMTEINNGKLRFKKIPGGYKTSINNSSDTLYWPDINNDNEYGLTGIEGKIK
jgi:hypothetical protein